MSYMPEPNAVSIRLTPTEVRMCNQVIQVYSKSYVYYRSRMPEIISDFKIREFRMYEHHSHAWLDSLLDAVAEFNH